MIDEPEDTRSTLGVEFDTVSYRHAVEILNSKHAVKCEIEEIIKATKSVQVQQGPQGLTTGLMSAFLSKGWVAEKPVSDKDTHEQRFDLFKERVAIEIEFSRYEFVYRDYFRFLSAYNVDMIDVGVLITHAASGLTRVKHPGCAPSLTRIKDDFSWLRPSLTVPIWVIALK
jgi:hypothetical protein